mmetsp:Transcript_49005/g.122809  ORF Transcript_49005/g.122809 Transcript_49005/m.122809 type:complete len:216 (-) Transcript_49005:682-1329(-)
MDAHLSCRCIGVCLSTGPTRSSSCAPRHGIHAARRLTPPTTPHHTTPRDRSEIKDTEPHRQVCKSGQKQTGGADEEHSAHDATTVSVCSACVRVCVRVCVHKRRAGRWKPRGNVATLASPPVNVSQSVYPKVDSRAGRGRQKEEGMESFLIQSVGISYRHTHTHLTHTPSLTHPTAPRPVTPHTSLSSHTTHVTHTTSSRFTSCLAGPYLPSLSV